MNKRELFTAFAAGLLFSIGLGISGMLMPSKVVGFLNITGAWDPSLAGVMGGGILVAIFAFRYQKKCAKPLCADGFEVPTRTEITPSLVVGSAMFGVGWGIIGYCPGPAVSSLVTGAQPVVLFVLAMLGGMLVHRLAAPLWRRDVAQPLQERSVDA